MARTCSRGCCAFFHLREDNARLVLLFVLMTVYMLVGAAVFMALEGPNEAVERERYSRALQAFCAKYPRVETADLLSLLQQHADADSAGFIESKSPRWDFVGSFYFVGTVVSTIGFGMTTPRTLVGKIFLICYGFFGCAGTILYFNLFLERVVTLLACVLRVLHEMELKRKGLMDSDKDSKERRGSAVSQGSIDSWKPSVYWVMLILLLTAIVVACCASAMYQPVEEWSYFESLYFCFVTFATIGFGDYVVSQKKYYDYIHLYRLGNFVFIFVGCCCIYSLFNVMSIIIKQFLNWALKKLNCKCPQKPKHLPRRNAIIPGTSQRRTKMTSVTVMDVDNDSDSEGRRNSGEMISMRDFLQAKNISLAIMQKQLWETAQRGSMQTSEGFQGGVGPLAILNRKLGNDDI